LCENHAKKPVIAAIFRAPAIGPAPLELHSSLRFLRVAEGWRFTVWGAWPEGLNLGLLSGAGGAHKRFARAIGKTPAALMHIS